MIPENMQDLLRERNNAIVAIKRSAAGPHMSPVWYWWDGSVFYFRIGKNTAKYRHLQRDDSISLFITDKSGYRYIVVYGQAEILPANPYDIAAAIVNKYYAAGLASERMPPQNEPDVVTIKLVPDKVVTVLETIAQEAVESWLVD